NDPPLKLAIAASEWWHGQRSDTPAFVIRLKVVEPALDVRESRHVAPVALGWDVEHPGESLPFEEVRFPKAHIAPAAARLVLTEHVRESLLELQGNAFAHHAHGVHRVHEGLGARREHVASCYGQGHGACLIERKGPHSR